MAKITMDKEYRYRNGVKARILCVDRPSCNPAGGVMNDQPVVSMTSSGGITTHYGDGRYSPEWGNAFDLVEVKPYKDFEIDDKVVVWNAHATKLKKGHFAGVDREGRPQVWFGGATSYTADGAGVDLKVSFDLCEKYDEAKHGY